MALIQWFERYKIGVESIDNKHKRLFEIADELYMEILRMRDEDILGEIFVFFIEHTYSTFTEEENYMIKTQYPDYHIHKMEHDIFFDKLMFIFGVFDKDKKVLSVTFMESVKDWLRAHILRDDMKYADYITRNRLL